MCFLLFPVLVYGQGGVCKLRGVMQVRNGKTFPYQLVLNVKGYEVSGYSQTKLFDGTEPKTTVTGTLNKKNNSLKLREDAADNAGGNSISCFASVTLYYKFDNGRYIMNGPFKGTDQFGMYCGEGFILFDDPGDFKSIFGTDSLQARAYRDNQLTKASRPGSGNYVQSEMDSDSKSKKIKNGKYEEQRTTSLALNGRINAGPGAGTQKEAPTSRAANPTSGSDMKGETRAKNTTAGKGNNAENSAGAGPSEEKTRSSKSSKNASGTETNALKNKQTQSTDAQKYSVAGNNNSVAGAGHPGKSDTRKGADAGERTPQDKDKEVGNETKQQGLNKTVKSKNSSSSPTTKRNSKELATGKVSRETADTIEDGAEYTITAGVKKQFDWKTDSCIIEVYDGGVIDGDIITVAFNNVEVLTRYTLVKKKYRFRLNLTEKVSKIEIFAENEGKSPPNTANILLTDGNRQYRIKAYNEIGESAEILLKRK